MVNFGTDPSWPFDPELDELEKLSNGVIDLIERGHLDRAERLCLELKRRFPETIDWIERTAALHEARGQAGQAIDHDQLCIDFIERDPDEFDADIKDWYRSEIDRLRRPRRPA